MGYYYEQKKANEAIDLAVKDVLNGGELNISKLVLKITADHMIGEKTVYKRLEHWKRLLPGLEEKNNIITFNMGAS